MPTVKEIRERLHKVLTDLGFTRRHTVDAEYMLIAEGGFLVKVKITCE